MVLRGRKSRVAYAMYIMKALAIPHVTVQYTRGTGALPFQTPVRILVLSEDQNRSVLGLGVYIELATIQWRFACSFCHFSLGVECLGYRFEHSLGLLLHASSEIPSSRVAPEARVFWLVQQLNLDSMVKRQLARVARLPDLMGVSGVWRMVGGSLWWENLLPW